MRQDISLLCLNDEFNRKLEPAMKSIQHLRAIWNMFRFRSGMDVVTSDEDGANHDDVFKWKHYSAKLALCVGNSPAPVNSPHKRQ